MLQNSKLLSGKGPLWADNLLAFIISSFAAFLSRTTPEKKQSFQPRLQQ